MQFGWIIFASAFIKLAFGGSILAQDIDLEYIAYIRQTPLGYNVEKTKFLCAGVLVSLNHVLTTSSCVHGLGSAELLVIVGSLDKEAVNDGNVRLVETIEVHRNFTLSRHKDNIAMLQVG